MAKIPAVSSWQEYGEAATNPTSNKERAEIEVDEYYVVIGFEVNKPERFIDDVQDLSYANGDFGHAFFYIVKNGLVSYVFSFGPAGPGKDGWFNQGNNVAIGNAIYNETELPDESKFNRGAVIKDSRKDARPGTADYPITEAVKVFNLPLTISQGVKLEVETKRMRDLIEEGKQKYTVIVNDTCAETAREVLDNAGIETPSGSGWIKNTDVFKYPLAYAVNPYKWHKNFKKKYQEFSFKLPEGETNWLILAGEEDPLFEVDD